LKTYEDQTQKVIRKIDKVERRVEEGFCELVVSLIEIEKREQFLKDQVKTN